MQLNIKITGDRQGDLIDALEEVTAKLREYYTSGYESNTTSSYSFEVNGEAVDKYAIAVKNNINNIGEQRYNNFDEAIQDRQGNDTVCGIDTHGNFVAL